MSQDTEMHLDPTLRHDAVLLFDCERGNPNGDPDADNQPRIDPYSGRGLVSDACVKRKLRDYVAMVASDRPEYKILIEQGAVINNQIERGYIESGAETSGSKKPKENSPEHRAQQDQVRDWFRKNFFDVRMFGAVLSTGRKVGQVFGPVQVAWAMSQDPIRPLRSTLTRCAATEEKDGKENKTMGAKWLLPYALYRTEVTYNPSRDRASEYVTREDLQFLWDGLLRAWDFDRSAARGTMACRGLYIFTHRAKFGNAPAHQLFESVTVTRVADKPLSFRDYAVQVSEPPEGVKLTAL